MDKIFGHHKKTVLVVGGTGNVGKKVIEQLIRTGKPIKALVRPNSNASEIDRDGVEIVLGDLMDLSSLISAMEDVDCIIYTEAGYNQRRRGDSHETDQIGSRNLVDAAKEAGIRRVVLCSILNCDKAPGVPHFEDKANMEAYLEEQKVPFIALRPGAFLDQGQDRLAEGISKGAIEAFALSDIPITYVYTPHLAGYLVAAVDVRNVSNAERIDIGMERAISAEDLAEIISKLTGRRIRVAKGKSAFFKGMMRMGAVFKNAFATDMHSMFQYFNTGDYVAETSSQLEHFNHVPDPEEAISEYLAGIDVPLL